MANDVFANGREISCKAADGKSIAAFPDVCFTPPQTPATPPGVPTPYPNTAMAKDTAGGSKKVKISKKPVMLKNKSYFKKSTGDEAGSAPKKGVITSKTRGKVYFNAWSMDVKVEGKNVVRHLDLTTHNHASPPGNTPPWPYVDAVAMAGQAAQKPRKGNLKVKVVDRCTGDEVEGVRVGVDQSKSTNKSGEVKFTDLRAKAHTLKIRKDFPDCDYVTFVIHYPRVLLSHKARSRQVDTAVVQDGQTTELTVEIEVHRLVPRMVFHRRHIDLRGEDKYGHWWTVVDTNLSFGWWPKYPMGHPENLRTAPPTAPNPPPAGAGKLQRVQHLFSSAVYHVKRKLWELGESSPIQTLRGVEGELNGQTAFGGTPTRDPHEIGGDSGDERYQPVIHDCRTDSEIRNCMKDFASSYSGGWSWRFELGNHCHTFQKKMMSHCDTAEVKKLE